MGRGGGGSRFFLLPWEEKVLREGGKRKRIKTHT